MRYYFHATVCKCPVIHQIYNDMRPPLQYQREQQIHVCLSVTGQHRTIS